VDIAIVPRDAFCAFTDADDMAAPGDKKGLGPQDDVGSQKGIFQELEDRYQGTPFRGDPAQILKQIAAHRAGPRIRP